MGQLLEVLPGQFTWQQQALSEYKACSSILVLMFAEYAQCCELTLVCSSLPVIQGKGYIHPGTGEGKSRKGLRLTQAERVTSTRLLKAGG